MTWQDIALTIGSIVFIAALFPSLLSKNKPAAATSISTAIVLVIFSIVYSSLHLWVSSVLVFIQGLLWFVLGVQKKHKKRKN